MPRHSIRWGGRPYYDFMKPAKPQTKERKMLPNHSATVLDLSAARPGGVHGIGWGGTVTRNETNRLGICKCKGFHGPSNDTSSCTEVQTCHDMPQIYALEPCSPTNLTWLQPRPVWNSVGWRQGPRLFWPASWKLWAPWHVEGTRS